MPSQDTETPCHGTNSEGEELPFSSEWLEKLLNSQSETKWKLLSISRQHLGDGKGCLSDVSRLCLHWDCAAACADLVPPPPSLVLKEPQFQPPDNSSEIHVNGVFYDVIDEELVRDMHNRECNAYEFLTKFKEGSPIPLAKCYFAEKRTDATNGFLLLEDLSEQCGSVSHDEDYEEDRLFTVVNYIAKLHAFGFKHPEYRVLLPAMPRNPCHTPIRQFAKSIQFISEKFPDTVSFTESELRDLSNSALKDLDSFYNLATELFTPVLCHGDIQPSNILWKKNADGSLSGEIAAFLDLELCHTGHCWGDLGFQLVARLEPERRRAMLGSISERYLRALCEYSLKTEPAIKLNEFERIYNITLLQHGMVALGFSRLLVQMAEEGKVGKHRASNVITKGRAAIEDHLKWRQSEQLQLETNL